MKNRGQVTIFVIVGLMIVVVVGVAFYLSSQSLSKKGEKFAVLSVEEQVSQVKEYVLSCLDDALKEAVSYCSGNFPNGGPKCADYERAIEDRVKEGFCNCVPNCNDFSTFKNIQVEAKGEISIKAKLADDKKKITVTMEYPMLVKKGTSENMLGTKESPFTAEYALEQKSCVQIKLTGDDYEKCEAAEEKTVEVLGLILTYHVNDKVAIGETCIAC